MATLITGQSQLLTLQPSDKYTVTVGANTEAYIDLGAGTDGSGYDSVRLTSEGTNRYTIGEYGRVAKVTIRCAVGSVEYQYGDAGGAGGAGETLVGAKNYARHTPKAQDIKVFSDLTNVSLVSNGGVSPATMSIDPSSPFGGAALRVDMPIDNNYAEILFPASNVLAFDESIALRVWVDDPINGVGKLVLYGGTTGYAKSFQYSYSLADSNTFLAQGAQTVYYGKDNSTASGFVFGTDALQASKVRIFKKATGNTKPKVMWIQWVKIAKKARPKIVLTLDDASRSWMTILRPELLKRGFKATFAVNTGDVGTNDALYCGIADIYQLWADGNDVQPHNVTNTKYIGTNLAFYVNEYKQCCDTLKSWNIDSPLIYHAFVQGGYDQTLIDALKVEGLKLSRTVATALQGTGEGVLDDIYMLPMYNMGGGGGSAFADWLTPAKAAVDNAIALGKTVIIMGHEFTTGVPTSTVMAKDTELINFLDYVKTKTDAGLIDFVSISEWYTGLEGERKS